MKAILLSLCVTVITVFVLRHGFHYEASGGLVLALYFSVLGVLWWLRWQRMAGQAPSSETAGGPDRTGWPLPGPLNQLGTACGGFLFLGIFGLTNLLSLLNPFQAAQIIRQARGNNRLKREATKSGNDWSGYENKVRYRLPLEGEWFVYNGGDTPATSHSWDILGQRFALDFVRADADMRRHRGKGLHLKEYFCYGQPILAAADGTVVHVENRVGDAPLVGWGVCDFMARNFVGSHVIIRHAEGEYAVYAHLIKGSAEVHIGDSVQAGQPIARCGHSGHSSEPHLHFHLQDGPDFFAARGLPIRFHDLLIDDRPIPSARLRAGQRVRPKT
jgi:hypothetical protein